jgi:hypothetical protein
VALLHRLQTDESLARYAGWFIPLKIDTDGDDWQKWARRYRHEGNAIPIIFVVRADGEQLFGKSGSLQGAELPMMIEQVLAKAGTVYSDQQLQTLITSLEKARQLQSANDAAGAVRELLKIGRVGTLGKLGSYAEPAIEADALAQKLIEQGRAELTAAKEKLEQKDQQLAGAIKLAHARRVYLALPGLKEELTSAYNKTRAQADLRDTLKVAEQLDEAHEQLRKPANKRRAITTLRRIVAESPGTPAATLAADWLREHAPDEAVTPADAPAASAKSRPIETWTSDSGHTVEAALVGYGYAEETKAPFVVFETKAGKRLTVPLARLDAESQERAKQQVRRLREAGVAPAAK